MFLKEIGTWLWTKTPWWIKAPVLFIMAPIALVVVLLWYGLFLPWQTSQIEAVVISYAEKSELKYERLAEKQTLINSQMKENLERIDRHQVVMLEYIMRNQK